MNRKSVLWVSHFLPFPAKGGAQIRSFNLLKQLSQYHDVSLFCIVHEDTAINYFSSLDSALVEARAAFEKFCSDVKFLVYKKESSKKRALIASLLSKNSYSVSRLKLVTLQSQLKEYAKDKHFDSVHFDTIALVPLAAIFPDSKLILNHHNIESLMMKRRAEKADNILLKLICNFDAWKIWRLEARAGSTISTHLVCSDLDAKRLAECHPSFKDIVTIPNGIDCSSINTTRRPDGRSLLFVGGLDWYPNADAIRFLLLNIWPKIYEENIDLTLNIIGKNPPTDIKKIAARYKNVNLHGFVDDISPFYEEAWLYICPIRDGGGTKLKVLDAMAHGVPLLAHPVAMEGVDVIDRVHYYQASCGEEFVQLITDLYRGSDNAELIGECAKTKMFESYDYQAIGSKLSVIY